MFLLSILLFILENAALWMRFFRYKNSKKLKIFFFLDIYHLVIAEVDFVSKEFARLVLGQCKKALMTSCSVPMVF